MGKATNYSPTFPMYPAGVAAITPNDSADLATPMVIYVGSTSAGTSLKITSANGDVATITVYAGYTVGCQVRRVWATGTNASSLIGYY